MRIEPNSGVTPGQSTESVSNVTNAGSSQAARPLQSTVQNSGDQANLSPDALQLSNLSGALANVPTVRQDRVAPLAQSVQSGAYAPSNQQIAQALVRDFRSTNTAAQA